MQLLRCNIPKIAAQLPFSLWHVSGKGKVLIFLRVSSFYLHFPFFHFVIFCACFPIFSSDFSHEGKTHPKKPPTQIKTVCTNSLRKQFRDSLYKLTPFSLENKQKTDKRICTNCLCKLFLFGWVAFWVGRLPLI